MMLIAVCSGCNSMRVMF